MPNTSFPFLDSIKDKLGQFVVQFAFRIPIRTQLTAGEKKVLEDELRVLDPEHFQLFNGTAIKGPETLFQATRQLPVGPSTIMIPSFVFSKNSFSFIWPVRILKKYVCNFHSFDTTDMNRRMSEWVVTVQNVISNLNCQRTGKIYEIVLGRFTEREKANLFQKLFSINLSDVGGTNLTFTRYVKLKGFLYNIQTKINYGQQDLGSDFDIRMRIDINNRDLQTSMEPPLMKKVWHFADATINSHLEGLLEI
ncbi:MAG: hypothetical protein E3J56_09650 [Candidatus Aminicenantes bacterium]|nr:MAG: hypothetical protein E3J56_09650 [Candidatus Aminicenantes bacterium]